MTCLARHPERLLCAACFLGLMALAALGCVKPKESIPPEKQEPRQIVSEPEPTSGGLGAVAPSAEVLYYGSGFGVRWGGDYGARPRDVLEALIDRMEYLQQTPEGGDVTARVIWELHEARDLLDGKDPVTQLPLGNGDQG